MDAITTIMQGMNVGLIAFAAITIIVSVILGLIRGWKQELVRFGTLVLAAVLAFVLASSVAPSLLNAEVHGVTVNEQEFSGTVAELITQTISGTEALQGVLETSPTISALILGLPFAILAEFAFIFLYFIFKFIFWIIFLVFKFTLLKPKNGENKIGWAGALIGIAQGLVTVTVVMVLVIGASRFADGISVIAASNTTETESPATPVKTSDSLFLVKTYDTIGLGAACDGIFNSLSTVTVGEGEDACTVQVFKSINSELFPIVETLTKFGNITNESEKTELKDTVRAFANIVENSNTSAQVLSETAASIASAIKCDGEFMGINMNEVMPEDPAVAAVVTKFVDILAASTPENIAKDISTVADVVDILDNNGLISGEEISEEELQQKLDGGIVQTLEQALSGSSFEDMLPELKELLGAE